MNIVKCNSFQEWMDEIQLRNKDCELVPMDDPFGFNLGFYDSKNDEQVLVSLSELKSYMKGLSEEDKKLLRSAFSSQEGKLNFLKVKVS